DERLADPLGDAAMDLTLEEQRVDDDAAVVDGGVALDLDLAGLGIDLELADMAAIGEIGRGRRESSHGFEADAERGRPAHRRMGAPGDIDERDRAVGAGDGEAA